MTLAFDAAVAFDSGDWTFDGASVVSTPDAHPRRVTITEAHRLILREPAQPTIAEPTALTLRESR